MTALLTADEAARLRPGQRLVIVRAGDPAGVQAWTAACFVAPQDWVALAGRCPNTHLVEDQQLGGCRDCIDHKRIVPLYTNCPNIHIQMFTYPQDAETERRFSTNCECEGGFLLVGRGSIEVVPVVESFASGAGLRIDGQVGIWLWDGTNAPIFMGRADAPLPIPGHDFGIVIDCVEVAP